MWFYIVFPAFVAVVYDIITYNALIFLRQKAHEDEIKNNLKQLFDTAGEILKYID